MTKDNNKISKKALAEKLGISRSSLCYQSKMDIRDQPFKEAILKVLSKNPAYGHKRIAMALGLNKKRILRIMKKYGIKPYIRRTKKPIKKDDQGKEPMKFKNWKDLICPLYPGVFWAKDFTYLWYQGRFYYLATLIDVVSRKIIGRAISIHHDQALVADALIDALAKHSTPMFVHSDQGSEYHSEAYVKFVESLGITISMAPKKSPWKNGHQESFYSNFKLELGDISRFESEGQLIEAIYRQIDYYNKHRIHTAIKMPPIKYAEANQQYLKYLNQ